MAARQDSFLSGYSPETQGPSLLRMMKDRSRAAIYWNCYQTAAVF